MPSDDVHVWISFEDETEARTWMFDATFLRSNQTCIYGAGCQGVLDQPAEHLAQGCCSYGAHFVDDDDVAHVVKAFVRLTPEVMQFHADAVANGFLQAGSIDEADAAPTIAPHTESMSESISESIIESSENSAGDLPENSADRFTDAPTVTRLADDACIFLNRPGFAGGVGCALHIAALAAGERPLDWKPNVCWQVPIRLEHFTDDNGHVVSRVRAWERRDWGDGGADFAWWCTEAPEAYRGPEPVYVSAEQELVELVGESVYARLVSELALPSTETPVELKAR